MRPGDGERVQIEVLRRMTGEERMRAGAELYDLAREMAAASIRDAHPGIGESELAEQLKERMR